FPRRPSLPRVAAMIRVLRDTPWLVQQHTSVLARKVVACGPAVAPTDFVPAHVTSSLSRLSSVTAKETAGCARRHGGALLRLRRPSGLGSSRCAGTLQESAPGLLGATIPRVRPG